MKKIFLIYILSRCGTPQNLVNVCETYGVDGVAIKLLDGSYKAQPHTDPELREYFDALRLAGIEVEGWSYNYPDYPGPQGDAIEERRQKFGLTTWHLDIEAQWKIPYGGPAAFETLASKLKNGGFEVMVTSYRFPTWHPQLPWAKMNNMEQVDGWSPQVYWALRHDPIAQLNRCIDEYSDFSDKPIYPMGPTFGETFTVDGEKYYWQPSEEELTDFREACQEMGFDKIYYYSLDWVISKKAWGMLEAATGAAAAPPPPPPPPSEVIVPLFQARIKNNFDFWNIRNQAGAPLVPETDLGDLMAGSIVPVVEEKDGWYKISGWVRKDGMTRL